MFMVLLIFPLRSLIGNSGPLGVPAPSLYARYPATPLPCSPWCPVATTRRYEALDNGDFTTAKHGKTMQKPRENHRKMENPNKTMEKL